MDKATFFKLLDKYLSGGASPEEEQQLLNFYGSYQNEEKHPDLSSLDNKMLGRLMEGVEAGMPEKRSRIQMWKRLSIAASLLLISATGIYFYTGDKAAAVEQFAEINVSNDIAPGANKAILILADGSRISLDDTENGFVARQGGTSITKTQDGQIVYNRSEQALKAIGARQAANTIHTPKGGRYKIRLPDGSQVWLNSASTLSYPTAFTGKERRVKLIGEAYFEVARDESVPFRVESNDQVVEVLGTHFNINSYEDEDFTKTTLIEGSVRVIVNSPELSSPKVQMLKPGQQSLTNGLKSQIKIESTDTEKAVAWKNGYFKFKNTPIKDIMREIERWYDVELVYEGNISNDEFTGYVSNDVKISSVLEILEQSGGVKFTVKGRKLKIKTIQ